VTIQAVPCGSILSAVAVNRIVAFAEGPMHTGALTPDVLRLAESHESLRRQVQGLQRTLQAIQLSANQTDLF
jgi:hypothetical protein